MKKVVAQLEVLLCTKWTHGLLMAFGGGFIAGITSCLTATPPHFPGKADLIASLCGGFGMAALYIGKNMSKGTGTPDYPQQQA